jgi:L-ascorbate metabolism protein UlaG (beta-lactamase superfamily)
MKIKWYGHASFLFTSDQGVQVITDPYEPGAFGGQLSYGKITDQADIVLVSHDHADHNYTKDLGPAQIVRGSGAKTIKGIPIKGIATFHDPSRGSERGSNTIFSFKIDDIQVCHLGDLGHVLSQEERTEIGPVDLLIAPVGGFYTIDAKEATRVAEMLKPKILIPMHFKTEKCGFPIAPVEDFLKGKTRVKRSGAGEAAFDKVSLPKDMEVLVLTHAL